MGPCSPWLTDERSKFIDISGRTRTPIELEPPDSKYWVLFEVHHVLSPQTLLWSKLKNYELESVIWKSTFWTKSSNSKGLTVKFASHDKLQNALTAWIDMFFPWKAPLEGSALFITDRVPGFRTPWSENPKYLTYLLTIFNQTGHTNISGPVLFLSAWGRKRLKWVM